jgi:hypothetical protein
LEAIMGARGRIYSKLQAQVGLHHHKLILLQLQIQPHIVITG